MKNHKTQNTKKANILITKWANDLNRQFLKGETQGRKELLSVSGKDV